MPLGRMYWLSLPRTTPIHSPAPQRPNGKNICPSLQGQGASRATYLLCQFTKPWVNSSHPELACNPTWTQSTSALQAPAQQLSQASHASAYGYAQMRRLHFVITAVQLGTMKEVCFIEVSAINTTFMGGSKCPRREAHCRSMTLSI